MTVPGRRRTASFGGMVVPMLMTLALTLALTLAGCAPGTPYTAPAFPFLPGYARAQNVPPVLLGNVAWWRGLDDPVLDRLVGLALQDNLTLSIARERVVGAQAQREAMPGAAVLSPAAGLRAEGGDQSDPGLRGTVTLGLSWMLDPYGARRDALRAADARIDMSAAEADAAQLLVLYNIANAYLELRYRQRILALGQSELASGTQTLALTRRLAEAEEATRLDLTRTEARVAELRAGLPDQAAAVTLQLNEIAVLAGVVPGTLPTDLMAALTAPAPQPRPGLSPDVGIPADLLRNRPDIRVAERRYYAALAEIGVAQAGLYPNLSLTGTISLNALMGGGQGVARSAEYFFGPLVQFPALPLGSGRAVVEARHSQARQELEAWKSTVLGAILEVENALVDYQAIAASSQSTAQAARLYAEALGLTREVVDRGEATLGDLIDAQDKVAAADRALAGMALRHAQSFVALNVRLGAGHAAQANR